LITALAVGALALNLALALAWIGGWFFEGALLVRIGSLAVALAVTGTVAHFCFRRWKNHQGQAIRAIESLARLDPRQVAAVAASGNRFGLSEDSPWTGPLVQLAGLLARLSSRWQEAEHAQASFEVRARRFADQHDRIATVLDHLPEPVLAVDEYDELILSNKSASRLFGMEQAPAEHRSLEGMLRCDRLVQLMSETRKRRAPTTRTDELELQDPDGQKRWYKVTATNVANDGNGGKGAVAVLRDVSSQKVLQKRNAEFVSSVSHEMKTPLAGIRAYVEMLVSGEADSEDTRDEFLGVINSQADRLQRLVDNLLNLARIEAGVVQVKKQALPLNEILEEAHRVMTPSAAEKRLSLLLELSPMYLESLVDRDMILQVAINLLSNAVKYTPEGGRVVLRSRLDDLQVVFEVQDTGVGLTEQDRKNVFEKFYRVAKDRKMAEGTGLGLPLARSIVEEVHGGKLSVESMPGEGSTFRVTLPATSTRTES
jgi:two-component system phosphate regulon sensor histidine kinase PhoR